MTLSRLLISQQCYGEMLAHVQSCLPEEACGLLGGRFAEDTAQVDVVLPVENELHSPVRFRMAPKAQLDGFLWLEEKKLELVAIFHSHPTGPDHPSATDLEEFAYPGVLTLIWSPGGEGQQAGGQLAGSWQLRGFSINDGTIRPVQITIQTKA